MGNNQIKNIKKDISFFKLIDIIASKYILTQNFQDIQNIQNNNYCNDLIILTSEVLNTKLNDLEIEYLDQRVKKGVIIDKLQKENIGFFDKKYINHLDVKNPTKKKRICYGISKFYVKIAHLYSAIVSTINPIYTYNDEYGMKKNIPFMKKYMLPKDKDIKVSKLGLCYNRINSIIKNNIKDIDNNIDYVQLKNNICDLNKKIKQKENGEKIIETKSLIDEPGIPELMYLYMDVYDYNKNKFVDMSEESKKEYKRDLELFYKAFTGNNQMPSNINTFSDIKLRDYHNSQACKKDAPLNKTYKVELKNKLLEKYGNQVALMNQSIGQKQKQLINILEKVFVYTIHPETKNKDISLHPELNIEKLNNLISQARNVIVSLYIGCEKDFLNILESFEAVIQEQINRNTNRKIENIIKEKERILSEL
jgi:hypothetical protein